jgi:hypothetical protein
MLVAIPVDELLEPLTEFIFVSLAISSLGWVYSDAGLDSFMT